MTTAVAVADADAVAAVLAAVKTGEGELIAREVSLYTKASKKIFFIEAWHCTICWSRDGRDD